MTPLAQERLAVQPIARGSGSGSLQHGPPPQRPAAPWTPWPFACPRTYLRDARHYDPRHDRHNRRLLWCWDGHACDGHGRRLWDGSANGWHGIPDNDVGSADDDNDQAPMTTMAAPVAMRASYVAPAGYMQ